MTTFEKNPGSLVASSERTVVTYPSGLCRVDQVYTCLNKYASIHRGVLVVGSSMPDGNASPSIDGLLLSDIPQETAKQEGFTDFIVSGYGRTTTTAKDYVVKVKTVISRTGLVYISTYEIDGSIASRRGESLSYADLKLPLQYNSPAGFAPTQSNIAITGVSEGVISTRTFINWDGAIVTITDTQYLIATTFSGIDEITPYTHTSPVITVTNSRNFGEFSEIDFTTGAPEVFAKSIQ